MNPNPSLRDITRETLCGPRNKIEIVQPWKGCWRTTINGKPAADWSDEQSAIAHATRLGWRPDGKPGSPASLVNERRACFVNERELGTVLLSTGPNMRFTV